MGADLYIQSISRPLHDKYQPTFHAYVRRRDAATTARERKRFQRNVSEAYAKMYGAGYFRDPYNDSNLLWKLGLDYWAWFAAYLDRKGRLTPKRAGAVLAEVEKRRPLLDTLTGEEKRYFIKKYDFFVAFLKQAIERNECIECSI